MNILFSGRLLICLLLVFGQAVSSFSQTPLSTELQPDPAIRIGKLENGLTYYIRQNKKPEQKVELRLAINAGSINEDDDQLGLAHMAEHMAFNGTKNFKKNEIISFLQDIGVGFGNDLNAYTSFDETVYMLPIPTDKPGNLEKGFQVLEDWAHQVTYLDEDIESERAIIKEEARTGKGATDRMMRQVYPKLFAGSKYSDRLPIGSEELISSFKPEKIRKFYKDWYRPNLMAVAVVGDVHPDTALAMIRKHFSKLTNPPTERKRETIQVPAYSTTEALVVTDKEATNYSVNINYPIRPAAPQKTVGDYRNQLVRQIFSSILSQRLQELTQQADPPFVGAGAGVGGFVRGYESFSATAYAGTGDITRALNAVVEEIERVKRYGFNPAELERSKKAILTSIERAYNNRDKTESSVYIDEYLNHFFEGEYIPGIEKEFAISNELIPGITIEEVNAVAKELLTQSNRFFFVTGPEASGDKKLPSPQDLIASVNAKEKANITPYTEKAVATSIMSKMPKAGKLVKRELDKVMGVTKLTLNNGVTVSLKSTDFKNDQILMGATRNGGLNYYGLADKYNAQFAVPVVSAMGVGEFSPTDLRKALAGKTVSVSPSIGEITDGISGSSSNKDIETMLQLVHLYVTSPRRDTALFQSFVQRNSSQYAALSANPQAAFLDTTNNALYGNNPLAPIVFPKVENFKNLNLDRALSIYKERIGDASQMHFAFTGSFNTDSIIPLLETYLGSLPSSGKTFEKKDNKVRPVKGVKKLVVNKGKEEKSLILAFYTGEMPYTEEMDIKAQAISEILSIRILEELREKIQGIYGGAFYGQFDKYPYSNYSLILQLPCGPEKVDTLLKAIDAEISLLVTKGPEQSYLDKVRKQWIEEHKVQLKENATWLREILDQHSEKTDPKYFLEYQQIIEKLTVNDIRDAARKLLNRENVFTAVLMPELKVDPKPATDKKAF